MLFPHTASRLPVPMPKEDAYGNELFPVISSETQEQSNGTKKVKSPDTAMNYLLVLVGAISLLVLVIFIVIVRRKRSKGRYSRVAEE